MADAPSEHIRGVFRAMDFCECDFNKKSIDINNFSITGFIGVEELTQTFVRKVALPQLFRDQMTHMVKEARGFNFTIVGPRGNGRRGATRAACQQINAATATVDPHNYARNHLRLLMDFGAFRQPFVIYIDDFDQLCDNPEFVAEFREVCSGPLVSGPCRRVWIIMAMTNNESPRVRAVARLACIDANCVRMRSMPREVLVNYMSDALQSRGIAIANELSESQWDVLHQAVEGASVRDVNEFVAAISAQASQQITLETLVAKSHSQTALALASTYTPMVCEDPPPATAVAGGGSSRPTPTRFETTAFGAATGLRRLGYQPQTPRPLAGGNPANTPTDGSIVRIDWGVVETLYVTEDPYAGNGFISRPTIPRWSTDMSLEI